MTGYKEVPPILRADDVHPGYIRLGQDLDIAYLFDIFPPDLRVTGVWGEKNVVKSA